jgi:hypothetical protein
VPEAQNLPLPPEPPACVSISVSTPSKPVASVAQKYADVARKATAAVTAPDATPQYVREVHDADTAARNALSALEQHPTKPALKQARDAVRALNEALENSP